MSVSTEALFLREARIAGEAAFRTLHPPELFAGGESLTVALTLYRQAIHWALAAHALNRGLATQGTERGDTEQAQRHTATDSTDSAVEWSLPSLEELLTTTPDSVLRSLARDEAHLHTCIQYLRAHDYATYAQLNELAQHSVCKDLQSFYQRLMTTLEPAAKSAEQAVFRRNLRLLGLTAAALLLVFGTRAGFQWYKARSDLALDATWKSSSVYNPALECNSRTQVCKEAKGFFFHTRQENTPWLMLDLKQDRKFSSLEIVNRKDCCRERANPLNVLVSRDGKNWELVAQRKTEFSTFAPNFPEVSARYIRLEIPKPASILHLARVRVFP